jgi:hypothetical protein
MSHSPHEEKGALSYHQNAGQNWDIKIENRSFETVAQFRYFGPTITSQNLIQGEN